ncbi:hypothetical protein [Pseudobacteriovorax antillogorgiicola]|uniref:Uncharacterized protein n=1 Tax=Pseudobacteriovorax antillogorgiicola TaxID=1513793 RepID=A0A1Y6CE58_9BACT|nr:hypothetical protein [Pseudobacteriovorax antillogorgiicola]TCS48002.1 hypothetical protein EDD56_119113 [Pseudobacteriovorax antillogorgiicola]SMF58519.1 hypothetical protein SAMN06296036_119114 [Pseudobacteriovorax antillogorgiicola]
MTYRRMIYRMIYIRGSIGKFEVHTDLDSQTLGFGFPLSISEGKSYLNIDKEFVSVAVGFNHFLGRNFYLGVEFFEYIQKIGGNSGTHLSIGSLSSSDLQDEYQDIKTFSKAPIHIQPSLSLGFSF